MSKGFYVDISSHNGWPDLAAYWAAGYRELMVKATEGTGYAWLPRAGVTPGFAALAKQWHALGGQVGYYHWLYGTYTGASQFDWFWKHVAPVFMPGDWLMTDFEDVEASRWVSDAAHLAVVKEFEILCDQKAPTHSYAPNWYLASMPLCIAYFKTRRVVASDYSHNPALNPHGFALVAHQSTDRATVPGFARPVDLNAWLIQPSGDNVTVSAADVLTILVGLLTHDGPLRSPADAADHATNPTWAWQTHIEATTKATREGNTNALNALRAAQAAQKAAEAAHAADLQILKILTGTPAAPGVPAVPGLLARVADIQAAQVKLAAQLAAVTAPGQQLGGDLAAVQAAAHAGAMAGASLDGSVLTIRQNGGVPA